MPSKHPACGPLPLFVSGILLFALAVPAPAAITFYGTFKREFYMQTSDAQPLAATGLDFIANLFTNNPADLAAATVTPPGGSAIVLSLDPGGSVYGFHSASFADRTALNTSFPSGAYTFDVSGGALGAQTGIAQGLTDNYPSSVPYVTGNTFTLMQNLDPDQPFTLNFNGFMPGAQATVGRLFVGIFDTSSGINVFNSPLLAPDATSILLPASTLQPNEDYTLDLLYSSESLTSNAGFNGATSYSVFEYRTAAAIHTIPEPDAIALCLAAAACLAGQMRRFSCRRSCGRSAGLAR